VTNDTKGPVRVAVAGLFLSAAGFLGWQMKEGFLAQAHIPTAGDVPTIGHGSTRYENGTPVRLTDPPISRSRAAELARNLHSVEEARLKESLPGVWLTQGEYDLYLDFVGQYGIGNWRGSSMRRELLSAARAGGAEARLKHYRAACDALLLYRHAAGYDCSTRIDGQPNRRCWGVWERQRQRHALCLAEQ
jgi:lysozyme